MKTGDLFFFNVSPDKILRVHRTHGKTVFYLSKHFGANPPSGILRKKYDISRIITVINPV